jgi:hypothetical protein
MAKRRTHSVGPRASAGRSRDRRITATGLSATMDTSSRRVAAGRTGRGEIDKETETAAREQNLRANELEPRN